MSLRHSPLDAVHRRYDAKMVEFGGWDMPLSYPTGTLAEHDLCRNDAVVFDVSHLGTVRVSGPSAFALLQKAFTNDLNRIDVGQAQYTHLLDPNDGSVTDDIIVWWVDSERFDVMPNASNTSSVTGALAEVVSTMPDAIVDIADTTAERAVLAIQGPNARRYVESISAEMAAVPRFAVQRCSWQDHELVVAGTGYTGEDGIEIAVPAAVAPQLFSALIDAGCKPAGLGARDTLRLEAGLPLHGHELGPGITPLQAGLRWVVRFDKGDFRGKDALVSEDERGVTRRLRGIVTEGRRPARQDATVLLNGNAIGTVTSGNYSPILGHGIAFALIDPSVEIGQEVVIDVRGHELPGTVVKTPFYVR